MTPRRAAWEASRGRAFSGSALLLLGLCGCAHLASQADAHLYPGPSPVVGMAVGAGVEAGLVAVHAKWWEQLGTVAAIGAVGRFTPAFGRKLEGWHLEVSWGAGLSWVASLFACRGPCR